MSKISEISKTSKTSPRSRGLEPHFSDKGIQEQVERQVGRLEKNCKSFQQVGRQVGRLERNCKLWLRTEQLMALAGHGLEQELQIQERRNLRIGGHGKIEGHGGEFEVGGSEFEVGRGVELCEGEEQKDTQAGNQSGGEWKGRE